MPYLGIFGFNNLVCRDSCPQLYYLRKVIFCDSYFVSLCLSGIILILGLRDFCFCLSDFLVIRVFILFKFAQGYAVILKLSL